MPKVRIKPGKTAFIHGTLYRENGVAQIGGKKSKDNPEFNETHMVFVADDTPISIRGERQQKGPQAIRAADLQEQVDSIKKSSASTDQDEVDEETATAIQSALSRLDHSDDAHWTKEGLPDMTVVVEYAGKSVTRKQVEVVAPDLKRRK